jgi:hypothetical protein
MKIPPPVLAVLLSISLVTFSGCGPGEPDKPVSIASEARVNDIVAMRKIFDQVKGDWEALSPADKAEYTKLAGDDEKAKLMWANMKDPMSANAAPR